MNRISGGERPGWAGDAGYTLLELLTVMALLGVLASLAVPRLDFEGMAVAGEAQAVGSELFRAQRRAVQQGHEVVVAVDVVGRRLRIHDDLDGDLVMDGDEEVAFHPLEEGVRIGRGSAPSMFASEGDVTFTLEQGDLPAVVFHRNGSASEEGGFYLTSARAAGDPLRERDTRAVRIQRASGRPEWFRYTGTEWERGS